MSDSPGHLPNQRETVSYETGELEWQSLFGTATQSPLRCVLGRVRPHFVGARFIAMWHGTLSAEDRVV